MIEPRSPHQARPDDSGQGSIELERKKKLFDGLLAYRNVVQEIADSRLSKLPILKLVTTGNPLNDAEGAKDLLSEMPTDQVLEGWLKELEQALLPTADEEIVKILLSMMLDGFAKQGGTNCDGYHRALDLAYSDKRLSLDLIAYTIRRILLSRVFPPSVSEFVAEYEAVRRSTEQVEARVHKAIGLRKQAIAALLAATSHKEDSVANLTGKETPKRDISSQCKMKGR